MKTKKFIILTLFPELFTNFLDNSIVKKAITNQQITVSILDIRQFSNNKHQQIDDYPYGGGSGMVLQAPPVIAAIKQAKTLQANSKVIFLSPQGQTWNQKIAYTFSEDETNYILLCGHYEGIDERVLEFVDQEISIGDYVLTGGELPAMILVDTITRLIPDVIVADSHLNDSFNNDLLDYPSYTRPAEFNNLKVPEVLLSGHHKEIAEYRKAMSLLNTEKKRPDLFAKHKLTQDDEKLMTKYRNKK